MTPTIASDLADYQPGATVTLTGTGWLPDTSVRIVVNDTYGSSWKRDVVVPVDAEGIVTDAFTLPTWFVSAYDVSATGAPSGRVAVAAFTDAALPASVSLTNWQTKNGGDWVTATLAANNSDYAEGETVPFRIELGSLTSGQTYYAPICRDYANSASGPYGYTTLLPFDTSRPATAGGTITSSSGAFSGVGITIGQVYDAGASSGTLDGNTFSCGSTQRLVIVKFVSLGGGGQYLLWGGRLAAPGDTNPFVAYGNGSSSYPGGSLQMRLASPDKTGGINPGAIVVLARLSVTKVVDSGTAPPDAWSFTVVGPDGYNRTLDVPDGQSTVQFLGLQTGTYTVTESDVLGYSFASGSGTSCTFTGSTATAGVVASTGAPTNATCTFHNALVNASIDVEKSVWDGSAWQDADAATGPYLLGPAAPVFRFVVTNTGDAPLSSVQLSDSPTIADLFSDQALTTACEPPTALAPAATFTCYGSLPWAAGQQGDIATATGSVAGSTYSDTDPAYYVGAAPAIDVQKTPDTQVVVAGSTATFTIVVTNTGNVPLTSVAVTDPVAPSCDATIGPLAVGGSTSYQCTTVNLFTGFTNTASVSGTYGGTTVTDSDDAVVSIDVLPDITVVKTADPTEVPETGGDVTFTVDVTNNSSEDFTLSSLVDDPFGDLDGVGTCDVPQTVPAGATYSCAFTTTLASDTLTPHTDTVTASGVDPQGHPDSDDDDATVTFTDVAPSLDVTKTADPSTVPETGGDVAFTFRVHNTSTSESVTITALTDSVYGTLAGDADCQVGTVLAADGACEFTATAWVAGDSSEPDHVNVFTAHAVDNENTDASDSDDATVDLTNVAPTIEVTKSADPTEVPETGGSVMFTFTVRNTSPDEAVEITLLEDSLLGALAGDVDCSVGTWLSGATIDPVHATCTFQVTTDLAGDAAGPDHVNTFTAHAEDNEGTDARDDDDATVGFSDVLPTVELTKSVDVATLPEPGGVFTFTLEVENTSVEPVTITALSDENDLSPECLALVGTSLAAGASASCSYEVTHTDAGSYGNTASVTVTDNEGNPASDTDDETVTVSDVLPTVELTKSASPSSLGEPGGVFTFTLSIRNTSLEQVTIEELGDTNALSVECVALVGTSIPADGTVTCTYEVTHTDAGSYPNTASVTVSDDDGNFVPDTDDQTVTVSDVLPTVELTKSVDVATLPEPGGVFTFTLEVENTSVEPVSITALSDENALSPECLALVGTWLAAGASASCSYEVTHTDAGSYGNTASVTVTDNEDNPASDTDDETVTVSDVLPTVDLTKSASPTTLPEPGGVFTFTLEVENTSVEPVTITDLTDTNALSHECQELVGTVLGVGSSVTCTYEVELTDAGVYDNTATVTVADDDGSPASAADSESVSITDTVPTITVEKSADPTSVPETGGSVDFTFEVTGTSMEPVTIVAIVDDVFGTLAGDADCQVGTILWNGASCTFTLADQWLTGEPSSGHTNTVTVTATDDEGNTPTASDDATVTFTDVLPEVAVTKTADPSTVPETGADVTFTFVVTNTSADEAVTVTELSDDVLGALTGDADCQVGTVLAAGASCDFSVTVWIDGDTAIDPAHTNVFTAAVEDNEGNSTTDTDDETVTVTDVAPTISVTKTANPTEVPETGGDVTFTVVVTNTSADETVEIIDLVDDEFGLLTGDDDCAIGLSLAAGAFCELTFTEHLQGDATTSHTDVVSVSAVDNEGTTASASDDAVVTFTDVAPTLQVAKTAMPNALPETGGDADFHFVVTNTSPEAVTITALADDVFGTLSGDADCKVGTVLQVGGSCEFDLLGRPLAGDVTTEPSHTDVFTATVVDNEETPATASDDATVTFTDVLPDVEVTKTANPTVVPETGQVVTFSVAVENPGTEAVTITSLIDDVFGDLLDGDNPDVLSTTCTSATIPAGDTLTCTFTAFVAGDAEASYENFHQNRVSVEVADNEGNTASDTDDAVVDFTDVDPKIDVEKYVSIDGGSTWKDADSATGPVVTAGSAVRFRFVVTNPGDVTVRLTLTDSVYTLAGCVVPATLAGHAVYTCTLSTTAVTGQHVDTATATGSITDGAGNVERATDTDKAHYLGTANTGALTIGYWQNKNGQSIITSGASTSGVCRSGTWLRQYKPFQDLSSTASCAKVAAYVVTVVKAAGASGASMNAMLKGQMLATALNVYFSSASLGGNKIGAPAPIGDLTVDLARICTDLTCTAFESSSTAFGGTPRTVSQMLAYAASQSSVGASSWYGQVKATQELAKDAFDALNNRKVVIVP